MPPTSKSSPNLNYFMHCIFSKMQAQTICKKQQKNTLSAKKKKKQTIKTVLATPYGSYWPLISEEDHNNLVQTLIDCLPKVRSEHPKIRYEEIMVVPKNERKQFRLNYNNRSCLRTENEQKECSNLVFGVNSVTTSIEKDEIGSILIANEVQPRLFVQHVIDMAVLNQIPILIVKDFKKIINEYCGITTAVFGVKKNSQNDLKTNLIHQLICNIYENYPVPTSHRCYNQLQTKQNNHQNVNDNKNNKNDDIKDDKIDIKSLHLQRGSGNNKRIFVPEVSKLNQRNSKDFLHLSTDDHHVRKPIGNMVNYRAMIVKRLKGDPNRNLRKIEDFKKKKMKK